MTTPGEHRALAEKDIALMRGNYEPSDPEWGRLAASAQAHLTAALLEVLAVIELNTTPPEPLRYPGLPEGYSIEVRTSQPGGSQTKIGYALTVPAGYTITSRYLWDRPETALAAGIRAAREHAAGKEG